VDSDRFLSSIRTITFFVKAKPPTAWRRYKPSISDSVQFIMLTTPNEVQFGAFAYRLKTMTVSRNQCIVEILERSARCATKSCSNPRRAIAAATHSLVRRLTCSAEDAALNGREVSSRSDGSRMIGARADGARTSIRPQPPPLPKMHPTHPDSLQCTRVLFHSGALHAAGYLTLVQLMPSLAQHLCTSTACSQV